MPDEIAFAPAVELARLVARGQISPVELVSFFAERIERLDKDLNSVVTLDAERALAVARKQEAVAGTPDAPPLLGVPILIKDLTMTAGLRTTYGTATCAEFVPPFDDGHIVRLRHAGFILLGKTNVPEWGTVPFTESRLLGPCRNPWDLGHTPGGSSGGAAAAMAAGLTPVAHGSDGAGSIRIPASNCGLFGIKPSRGRISKAPIYGDGMLAFGSAGPIARHVIDAATLLDVLRGTTPGDPYWAPEPPHAYAEDAGRDPRPLLIGMVDSVPWATFGEEACAAVDDAVTLFERLGHTVEACALPLDEQLRHDFEVAYTAGLAANPVDHATFEPYNAGVAEIGRAHSAPHLLTTTVSLQQQSSAIVRAAMRYDVICSPTLTRPTLRIGELAGLDTRPMLNALERYIGLTPLANVTGQPSMSLPLHWTSSGLPVGVMVTGRPADETTLFQLAGQAERATGWPARRPPIS
ncbi:MAG: amidase [Egibacteraceae bacterium]